jgi:SAM-dependent methyltransferase
MGTVEWGPEIAAVYDATYAAMATPEVLGPMVDRLAELAGGGAALELAIGTGRVALALQERGVEVHGVELSAHMVEQLRAKRGGAELPVTIGDMAGVRLPRTFRVVYLVANTIMNLTEQDEQVAVFERAAEHLEPGGTFVLEVIVPQLRDAPAGQPGRIFTLEPSHVGIETFEDIPAQIAWSHHWIDVDGRLVHHAAPYRYVWPGELDLMARIAGLRLRDRWSDWQRAPFTKDSASQVAVYERPRS